MHAVILLQTLMSTRALCDSSSHSNLNIKKRLVFAGPERFLKKTSDFNPEPSFLKNPEFKGDSFLENVATFFIE